MRWVVKVGGSLARYRGLREWMRIISTAGAATTVVVPGGGPFADAVRRLQVDWRFDDVTAHRMSLLAMEQYAHLLLSLAPGLATAASVADMQRTLAGGRVPVWLPSALPLGTPGLSANWDTTSDSLALWLATTAEAEALFLVKSVPPPAPAGLDELALAGLVDRKFVSLAGGYAGAIVWIDRADPECLGAALQGEALQNCGTILKRSEKVKVESGKINT